MSLKNALLAATAFFAVTMIFSAQAAYAQDALLGLVNGKTIVTINPETRAVTHSVDVDSNALLGMDIRPADGKLYGVTNRQEIVTIDHKTGKTQKVSTISGEIEVSTVTVVDFNPVLDRLRIVDSNNGSHRINIKNGENTIDGILFFNQHDVNSDSVPRVIAGSYTNSVKNQITTELYNIDADTNSLVLQNPPNAGMINTVAKLDIPLERVVSFNIVYHEGNHQAWLANGNHLYEVNLKNGKTKSLGEISGFTGRLMDLAWVYEDEGRKQ